MTVDRGGKTLPLAWETNKAIIPEIPRFQIEKEIENHVTA